MEDVFKVFKERVQGVVRLVVGTKGWKQKKGKEVHGGHMRLKKQLKEKGSIYEWVIASEYMGE